MLIHLSLWKYNKLSYLSLYYISFFMNYTIWPVWFYWKFCTKNSQLQTYFNIAYFFYLRPILPTIPKLIQKYIVSFNFSPIRENKPKTLFSNMGERGGKTSRGWGRNREKPYPIPITIILSLLNVDVLRCFLILRVKTIITRPLCLPTSFTFYGRY